MQRSIFLLIAAISVAGIAWLVARNQAPAPEPTVLPPPVNSTAAPQPTATAIDAPATNDTADGPASISETAEDQPPAEPLPALTESDGFIAAALGTVIEQPALRELFNLDQLARRLVVAIDSLPRARMPQQLRLIEPPSARFQIAIRDGETFIADTNAARYERHVALIEAADVTQVVALYRRLYPLLQQGYAGIAPPNASFHQRVLEALDDLLAAAPVAEPVRLVQPKVFYEFADPEVQARSYGQRLLARIGTANTARIKPKLQELRAALR
ncbi:MAG: DUF3014 domain-containing protein [Gammaproteobacteria bacterium]|nr:DUF3014 domain-containing protein [Gammaproteobacteria bacterium]